MKTILGHIKRYFIEVNKKVFVLASIFIAALIFLNYRFHADDTISDHYLPGLSFISRYGIFLLAFSIPYLLYVVMAGRKYFAEKKFLLLLFIAPAIFAMKMLLNVPFHFSDNPNWNYYWNHVLYWPLLVVVTSLVLFVVWKLFDKEQPFYGIKTKHMNWRPYWLMLLIMLPLVASASTQPDFLAVYPKLKSIASVYNEPGITWWHKLLFELSYGSDFITIELFFRGFLILAFVKWAGKDAILPMACFYCTIHFGKPLGECISSYFGGMILGVVVYHTRSIFGGLMVHLGIAWLMELGGYIGNTFIK